jgi:hypothetical protein
LEAPARPGLSFIPGASAGTEPATSKTPLRDDRGGALVLGTRGEGPTLPSHDSQLSKLAIAITIPVAHAAKHKNSRRSLRRKAILAPTLAFPVLDPS